jgi:hypothetical protein
MSRSAAVQVQKEVIPTTCAAAACAGRSQAPLTPNEEAPFRTPPRDSGLTLLLMRR